MFSLFQSRKTIAWRQKITTKSLTLFFIFLLFFPFFLVSIFVCLFVCLFLCFFICFFLSFFHSSFFLSFFLCSFLSFFFSLSVFCEAITLHYNWHSHGLRGSPNNKVRKKNERELDTQKYESIDRIVKKLERKTKENCWFEFWKRFRNGDGV